MKKPRQSASRTSQNSVLKVTANDMGGTRLKSESWKMRIHTQNASQSHFYCSLKDIWTLKSGSSLKSPTHVMVAGPGVGGRWEQKNKKQKKERKQEAMEGRQDRRENLNSQDSGNNVLFPMEMVNNPAHSVNNSSRKDQNFLFKWPFWPWWSAVSLTKQFLSKELLMVQLQIPHQRAETEVVEITAYCTTCHRHHGPHSYGIKAASMDCIICEPVWLSGKALGW